jgi:hypothetical protein
MQVLVRTWSNLEVSKTVQAVEITELVRGEAIALYQAWIVTNVRLGVCFVDGISSTGSYFIRVGRVSKWTAVDDCSSECSRNVKRGARVVWVSCLEVKSRSGAWGRNPLEHTLNSFLSLSGGKVIKYVFMNVYMYLFVFNVHVHEYMYACV